MANQFNDPLAYFYIFGNLHLMTNFSNIKLSKVH